MRISRKRSQLLLQGAIVLLIIINITPVLWMISSAFKLPTELFTKDIRLIPHAPTWENFRVALTEYDFVNWLLNSVATTIGITILQVSISVLVAFALSYYNTRYNQIIFYFLLITMVIPFQVTMIPNYILVSKARLLNTWWAVILANAASASTFFYLRQHFRSVPRVFYEVAGIEGASSFWTLTNVVLGICKGSISAIAILTLIDSWNLYFWPLLVLTTPEKRTLTVGLRQFLDFEMGNRWGPFMATATLASLPIIVLYLFIQRNIMDAFVSSGIKG